jgi:simple sugar transport system permease protein
MLRDIFNFTLIASTLRLATPLVFAAIGGLYSERSGVINIALEGMMLAGAFTAALVTFYAHNPWVGVLAAIGAGALIGLLHGAATVTFRADQVVSGTAINILFLGVPALLSGALFDTTGSLMPHASPRSPQSSIKNRSSMLHSRSSH